MLRILGHVFSERHNENQRGTRCRQSSQIPQPLGHGLMKVDDNSCNPLAAALSGVNNVPNSLVQAVPLSRPLPRRQRRGRKILISAFVLALALALATFPERLLHIVKNLSPQILQILSGCHILNRWLEFAIQLCRLLLARWLWLLELFVDRRHALLRVHLRLTMFLLALSKFRLRLKNLTR